ncbi:MAG: hypothetical protein G01um101433_751 [Parcubacteria group bacterium Gr01-1014_33]|nr:MAG: hypothetical protein G01um101433_751 [Parcubacteria group bacterium Gr01-1014_33]
MPLTSNQNLFAPAAAEEQEKIFRIAEDHFSIVPTPEKIERYAGRTASARIYRFFLSEHNAIIAKESFWYEAHEAASARAALEKAYAVSEALRGRGIPVPQVLARNDGGFVYQSENGMIAFLEYKEGAPSSFSDKEWSSAGSLLGRFHRAGSEHLAQNPREKESIADVIPVDKPYEDSRAIYDESLRPALLQAHTCAVPDVCRSVRGHIADIDVVITFIDASGVNAAGRAAGILHNDFNVDNVLFSIEGNAEALIDIDQMGVGPFVWDVGNTLASFGWKMIVADSRANFEEKTALFLRSYRKEFPLPPEEYLLILAATQRWDVMRILRSMRRHLYEHNRFPELLPKIKERLIPRIIAAPRMLSFITPEWIEKNIFR